MEVWGWEWGGGGDGVFGKLVLPLYRSVQFCSCACICSGLYSLPFVVVFFSIPAPPNGCPVAMSSTYALLSPALNFPLALSLYLLLSLSQAARGTTAPAGPLCLPRSLAYGVHQIFFSTYTALPLLCSHLSLSYSVTLRGVLHDIMDTLIYKGPDGAERVLFFPRKDQKMIILRHFLNCRNCQLWEITRSQQVELARLVCH